jgi:LemA protein
MAWPWLLAAAALLLFWVVGAWNRLVGLRNDVSAAWSQVQEALRARGEAVAPLLEALRGPLAAEQGALEAMVAAETQTQAAATALAARPLAPPAAAAWVAAEATLAAAATRVFALLDGAGGAAREPPLAALAARWREHEQQAAFARRLYNTAAETHDAALAQFPTSLLVRLFGFAPAGRL